ncbi:MAG: 2-oxoacid:acceptor oxidoreductase family protein [Thermoplasmata archaeon]|nr:2-oxoacid:acceptor oxidoreductase family protein [Thermoplasmata archaeon]
MTRMEVKMGGFGGQGMILAGYIIGKAAAVFDNKEAVQTQSYGPEARGGACSASVIIDEKQIDYPLTSAIDVMVLMSQEAYTTYRKLLVENGTLIIDEDLVHLSDEDQKRKVFKIPATKMAQELGRRIVANIVMLGFFTATAKVVTYDAMKQAVLTSIPKGTEELNSKAFEQGYQYGMKLGAPNEG